MKFSETAGLQLASVILIGFGHPESVRLAQELKQSAPEHNFTEAPDALLQDADPETSVAVIWCPRSPEDSESLIKETAASGLPSVAILQTPDVPRVDLSAAHIEFAFLPLDCTEALSRIEIAQARAIGPADRNVIRQGELVIDQDRYEVTLSGAKVDLTYKEYELLKYLAARPGRVFSREALLRAVWDYDYFGGTRTVDVHVRRLRSKISDVRYQFIETVWNVGYRFRSAGDSQAE